MMKPFRAYLPPIFLTILDKARNYEPYLESRPITHVITGYIFVHTPKLFSTLMNLNSGMQ